MIIAAALVHGVNTDYAVGVADCETGGTFDPHITSSDGEYVGLYQLARHGKLSVFYADGYTDWADPAQQADFFSDEIARGQAWAWPRCSAVLRTKSILPRSG
jgi:hypothetical protein